MFRISGCRICLRLKARSWEVSAAAWRVARTISSRFPRPASPAGASSRASSVYPRMTERRLLKSWAMPPASIPTVSIFCICTTLASSRFCSEMSIQVPTASIHSPSSAG